MSVNGAADGVSRDEFVRNLDESGLSIVDDARAALGSTLPADGAEAARRLVEAGTLTAYQADAVLHRRFGELRMGNYDVLDRLGAGGMGTVFKARHRRMKRVVALKVLSREVAGTESFAQRFQREVETIARLNHPNIVMAFDADEAESGPFLVMEFVNGRDLASEVQHGGPVSPADAVEYILQAARGLECAHAQGIVHRDIKPGNLLRDAHGVVKVADLGLARLNGSTSGSGVNTSLTQAGGIVGTMDYMPPEQALDSTAIDHRVDIYSLGCTLHFLLTGRPPYEGGSIMALLLKHRDAPIPYLCDTRPDVPPELDAVFRKMVAKAPEDRHQTMTEVVRVLEDLRVHARLANTRPAGPPTSLSAMTATTMALSPEATLSPQQTMVAPAPILGALPTPTEAGRIAGLAVVVAEPSRTQAGIIRRYLGEFGVKAVHTTGSGAEALTLVKREGAAVLLASMHLSDMTGVRLAHELIADAACASVGFVLATSEADTEEAAALPPSPRVVVMPKPFDLQRLAQAIAQAAG